MPDDVKSVSAYEQDFYAWGLAQAEALRAAGEAVVPPISKSHLLAILKTLDWANLAEEIEGLARRDRRELTSRIVTIIEHLVKLEHGQTLEPRRGWINTVEREREEVEGIVRDSPSLRRELPDLIAHRTNAAVRRASLELIERGELTEAAATRVRPEYSESQVLGDWLPAPPPPFSARPDGGRSGA